MAENKKLITLEQAPLIKQYIDNAGVDVDTALNSTSTNPVQNKVVSAALNERLSTSGGTITGNLTLKGSGNYGNKINFGDGDYVHLYEVSDDKLEIKAKNIDFVVSEKITKNGAAFDGGTSISSVQQTTTSTADGGNNVITVTLSDGTSSTFTVKNGSKGSTGTQGAKGDTGAQGPRGYTGSTGTRGSRWNTGTAITGTSTTATVFSSSGITDALVNDMYLNTSTMNTYRCTVAGSASTAKWVYVGCIKGATGARGYTGSTGATGVGISTVKQTTTSSVSGGKNVVTVTKTDGTSSTFSVYNGAKGDKGDKGDPGDGGTIDTSTLYITAGKKSGTTLGTHATAEGYKNTASGQASHAEGELTQALTDYCHAEGYGSIAGEANADAIFASHAEGWKTTASGTNSHAEGGTTTASGSRSHAEGEHTVASGASVHAEGYYTTASGASGAHAEGGHTVANGYYAHAGGNYTIARDCEYAIGRYNKDSGYHSSWDQYLVIGNGTAEDARSNCFRVTKTAVYGGTYNSSGADYAEWFEWIDNNPDNEDRRGLFVTLDGSKIRFASSDDDFILGIVSGMPSVIGDSYDDQWAGMYVLDIFGTPIFEDVEIPDEMDDEGNIIIPAHIEHRQKLNPEFDNTQEYVPRSKRKEWAAVGMMGKLVVVDDGSCVVNGWCKHSSGGVGTKSDSQTKFRVMERLDDNHVRVLVL